MIEAQDMGQVVGKTRHTERSFVKHGEIGDLCLVPQPSFLDKRRPGLTTQNGCFLFCHWMEKTWHTEPLYESTL